MVLRLLIKLVLLGTALCLLALQSGCAGGKTYGAVRFISEPAGAQVINLLDDSNMGATPLDVVWESTDGKSEYVTVEFRKHGYFEKITSFWVNKRHGSRQSALVEPQPIQVELLKRK